MSIKIMSDVWEHSSQSGSKLLLLLALADYADENGECYPSLGRLAIKCRCSRTYIKRMLGELAEEGEIEISVGNGINTKRGATNLYRLKGCTIVPPLPNEGNSSSPEDGNNSSPVQGNNSSPRSVSSNHQIEPSVVGADAPPPAKQRSPSKKKTATKAKDPPSEFCEIYRDVHRRYPTKAQMAAIDKRITDADLWRQACEHVRDKGWNPGNLTTHWDMYDFPERMEHQSLRQFNGNGTSPPAQRVNKGAGASLNANDAFFAKLQERISGTGRTAQHTSKVVGYLPTR